ncbi:hypothetical protein [Deinococcus cellulosilyticus]|uniref:Uncharacterized protein n=1 Tax=Deinococcus cellulosilyticus (strain DSM 18568 / NBRC 106333 / KACC 11606 / 5516J-15) TaxID=1223518 RepID=A0A511MZ80_DEIC1|nr:hypothetical protein [Deinococcus cellulosilyticus]GEM45903.1 hypothetical protein DC3_15380 [Deinococcus cellulosilyticus NBRC 106333 = KACC 11606]
MSRTITSGEMEPEKVPFSVYVGSRPEVGTQQDIQDFLAEQRSEDQEEGGEQTCT